MKKFIVSLILLIASTAFGFQSTIVVPNGTGAQFRTNMNNALQAISTGQSGTSAPSPTYAFQSWFDSSANPAVLKIRNSTNTAWITFGSFNSTTNLLKTTDADTVDGFHASQTPGANQIPVLNGSSDLKIGTDLIADVSNSASALQFGSTRDYSILKSRAASYLSANLYYDGSWRYLTTNSAALLVQPSSGVLSLYTAPSGAAGAVATLTGSTVWHSGNDGSGSGLDADTLDGVHATSFTQGKYEGDLRILRGVVQYDGTILQGAGFSISHTVTGYYTINFTTSFAATPTVVASCYGTFAYGNSISVDSMSASSAVINIKALGTGATTFNESSQNQSFSFIAIAQ